MKKRLVKLLLSISSFSGVVFFLLVGKKVDIPYVCISDTAIGFLNIYVFFKYLLFLSITLFLAWFSLFIAKISLNSNDDSEIKEIKPIESTFLPVYIGLFVIALSLTDKFSTETIFLLIVLFLFWVFLEGVSYFNPFLLFFGYRFYEAKSKNNVTFTLITKRRDIKIPSTSDPKNPAYLKINHLIRINNFTFIEK